MTKDQQIQLLKIYKKHKELTPDLVLSYAKNTENPLHSYFEWNDEKAAESHRKEQARRLIRCIVVPVASPVGNINIRAFVSLQEDPDANMLQKTTKTHYYKHLKDLTEDEKQQVKRKAMVELIEWRKKYWLLYNDFSSIMQIIDEEIIPVVEPEFSEN